MDADARVQTRLSGMMALVYSVQGAFWPLLSIHLVDLGDLGAWPRLDFRHDGDGVVRDAARRRATGRPVDADANGCSLVQLCGRGPRLLALIAWGITAHVGWLFGLFLVYWLIMAPSYSLSNSMAFRNLARGRPGISARSGSGGRWAGWRWAGWSRA